MLATKKVTTRNGGLASQSLGQPGPLLVLAFRGFAVGPLLLLIALLAGCTPAGPRALLDGRRLLEAGRYEAAVDQFKLATSLLQTNAQAWNYLGLAYHRAGQPTNAAAAYRKALALNQNLAEARFNLGSLLLEQRQFDAAKEQFITYTLQRSQAVEGFLKLGAAQFWSRESAAAEQSFQKALRLSEHHPEALNGLGLVQLQRNRPREAAQYFSAALQHHPNYRPALLNLATVSHRYLNDAPRALELYREYLALQPRAADWEAVNTVVRSLEQRAAQPAPTPSSVPPPATVTNAATPKPQPAHPVAPAKTNPPPEIVKTSPPAPPLARTTVVTLPPEPVIKTTPDVSPPAKAVEPPSSTTIAPEAAVPAPPAKRTFLQRLNPFRRDRSARSKVTPLPPGESQPSPATESAKPGSLVAAAPTASTPYVYASPNAPAAGDRTNAERAFAQGVHLQRANRLNEAAVAFQQATQLDPSYFEAHYQLGLVTYLARNYRQSLAAWEGALAVRPDSGDARYNFALTLKAAGHPHEAAEQLNKLLAANPRDARAHLMLGNLYAEPLRDPGRARTHYLRVLELEPRHPQATEIRYWLVANPP